MMKEFDFLFRPVEKVPLEELGFDYDVPSDVSHAIIEKVPGKELRVLCFCSEDYGLTTNEEITGVFNTLLDEAGLEYHFAASSRNRNSEFSMEWILKAPITEIQGDVIQARIYVHNSYNRRVKFYFGAGVLRQVCSNGLTIFEEDFRTVALHTSGIEGLQSAQNCIPMVHGLMENAHLITEIFWDLAACKVSNLEARVDEVIEAVKFPRTHKEAIMERIELEMEGRSANQLTDWLVYNGFNFMINHKMDLPERKASAMDRAVLLYLVS